MKKSEQEILHLLASYCSRAERCQYDIKKKMKLWEVPDNIQDKLINYLKSENYLNEERFTRSFINDKFKYNKWGTNKIIFELKSRKISENIFNPIINNLEKDDIIEKVKEILQKKLKTLKYKDAYDCKTKLIRFGLGRGFEMDIIQNVLKKINISESDDWEEHS